MTAFCRPAPFITVLVFVHVGLAIISGPVMRQATLFVIFPQSGPVKMSNSFENAVKAAIGNARRALGSVQIRWITLNDQCDGREALMDFMEIYYEFLEEYDDTASGASLGAIIGMTCNEVCRKMVDTFAPLGMTIFVAGCNSEYLRDRSSAYRNVMRLTSESAEFLDVFPALMRYYGWPRATIIQARDSDWTELGRMVKETIESNDFKVSEPLTINMTRPAASTSADKKPVITETETYKKLKPKFEAFSKATREVQKIFILLMPDFDVMATVAAARDVTPGVIDKQLAFITVGYVGDYTGDTFYQKPPGNDYFKFQHGIVVVNARVPITQPAIQPYDWLVGDAIKMWSDVVVKVLSENSGSPLSFIRPKILDELNNMTSFTSGTACQVTNMNGGVRQTDTAVYVVGEEIRLVPILYFNKGSNQLIKVLDGEKVSARLTPERYPLLGWNDERGSDTSQKGISTTVFGILMGCMAIFCLIIFVVAWFCLSHYRKVKEEKKMQIVMEWLVKWDEVIDHSPEKSHMMTSAIRTKINLELVVLSMDTEDEKQKTFGQVAYCKGFVVNVQKLHTESIDTYNPLLLEELKEIVDLKHENINKFIGLCAEPPNISKLYQYAKHGSLQDVLLDKDLQLSIEFKISLAYDIAKGMEYLHSSAVGSHGLLSSYAVVVDSRWTCKVSDYGLPNFRFPKDRSPKERAARMLWMAPELIRLEEQERPVNGTQRGDSYSYGIILQEIIQRELPFSYKKKKLKPQAIIENLSHWSKRGTPFRPAVTVGKNCSIFWLEMMQNCWSEVQEERHTFKRITALFKKQSKGKTVNVIDNMLEKLEKHTKNLEKAVAERNAALSLEKKKMEVLLYNMLPKTVADSLMKKEAVKPEAFNMVTVFFSDIIGFTKICQQIPPLDVCNCLTELDLLFDQILGAYDVHKCDTTKEACYMIASGLPVRNGDRHASELTTMSMHLLSKIQFIPIPHMPDKMLQLRIGLHSGPVVAGVIGKRRPAYCLIGDTVNTASRMNSGGLALRIHISETTANLLMKTGLFHLQSRGQREVTGKGMMTTYWVTSKIGFNMPMPDLRRAATLAEHDFK